MFSPFQSELPNLAPFYTSQKGVKMLDINPYLPVEGPTPTYNAGAQAFALKNACPKGVEVPNPTPNFDRSESVWASGIDSYLPVEGPRRLTTSAHKHLRSKTLVGGGLSTRPNTFFGRSESGKNARHWLLLTYREHTTPYDACAQVFGIEYEFRGDCVTRPHAFCLTSQKAVKMS